MPSSFAEFVLRRKIPGQTLIDLGCGNGRDCYPLSKKYKVRGVDKASFPDRTTRATFARAPWQVMRGEIASSDIVYSRFFLHTITPMEVEDIIDLTPKYFCAEARAVGDEPSVYPEHQRHFVDPAWMFETLRTKGFAIIYYKVGYGLARYKREDPLIIRVIAKRI